MAELLYRHGNPDNPFWLTRQAAALSRSGDYTKAIKIATQALSLQPTNPYATLAVAEALYGLNRIKEALPYFMEIADNERLSFFARRGILNCLAALGDWNQMLHLLSRWELPHDISYRWKVKALQSLNRMDEAISACREWLKISPDNPHGLWALTELEIKQEGIQPVLSRMGRLAKIPSRPPIYKEIYASLCRRTGKPELALEQYAKLTRGQANPKIYQKQAFALAKSGKELEAIPLMEELLRENPRDYYLHKAYIPACKRAGRLQQALRFYKELVMSNPEEKPLLGRIKMIQNLLKEELSVKGDEKMEQDPDE
ncbi:MAG: tetratricopeptide repeat protein [Deltaproteobacteria bacterium]|nr:tetratricopeptide repeat protein [Deltaproteobacteria bacterium]MBW2152697.1 tetratricopeptide repeat protein [Deltaproteobacteria bacterium]